jgi:Uma2 family endonuclease
MPYQARLTTADEFARIPDDDHRYELVDGRVVRMSPPGSVHGAITTKIALLLGRHADVHKLGAVIVGSGFRLATDPDTVRGPDLGFVRRDRIPATGLPEGFWPGPPDLAVEIRSPGDRGSEVLAKVDDYLTRGVVLVWVVDPRRRVVTVYRRLSSPVTLVGGETLDADATLPGFRCPIDAFFD